MKHFDIASPRCKGTLTDAQIQRQQEAHDFWHGVVIGGADDVSEAVKLYRARYGKAYKIPAFHDSGSKRSRKGHDLLGGSKRKNLNDRAGPLGTLMVKVGLPLQVSTIDFADLPKVADKRKDATAQFDRETVNAAIKAVGRFLDGAGVAWVERGKDHGINHLHLAHAPGACALGRKSILSRETALATARYLSKAPAFTSENLAAYAETKRLKGRVTNRVRSMGLGSENVTLRQVQKLLGINLLRPQKIDKPVAEKVIRYSASDVGHYGPALLMTLSTAAPLPRMRLVSPKPVFAGGVLEPILTREQALNAVLETLPKAAVLPYAETKTQTYLVGLVEPYGSIWEPSEVYPGHSPPFMDMTAYQQLSV